MIVRLVRPFPADGPWLVYTSSGRQGFIEPTPALKFAMETQSGYFHAEPGQADIGWNIGEAAPDQSW